MKNRKLRIVWSVAWGVLCVLLIVLWVRSYWTNDGISRSTLGMCSYTGVIQVSETSLPNYLGWHWTSDPVNPEFDLPSFEFHAEPSHRYINVPHWLLILVLSTASAVPWMRSRFSLRTLLIGMTVLAALLGLTVWAVR